MAANNFVIVNDNPELDQQRQAALNSPFGFSSAYPGAKVEPGSNDFNDSGRDFKLNNFGTITGVNDDKGNFWVWDSYYGGWEIANKPSTYIFGGVDPLTYSRTIARPDIGAPVNANKRDLKKQIAKINAHKF